tara:strand:- start:774 stop:902 length:129 start_codon:yes stop_codon:yes gene_type:complete
MTYFYCNTVFTITGDRKTIKPENGPLLMALEKWFKMSVFGLD